MTEFRCSFCGQTPAEYEEITGFSRKRSGGGANQITARRLTGNRACRECVEKAKRGIPFGQMSLL